MKGFVVKVIHVFRMLQRGISDHLKRRTLDEKLPRSVTVYYNSHNTQIAILADRYNTDKGTVKHKDDKFPWPCHTYSDIYELLFMGRQDTVRTVFECGIGSTNASISDTMTTSGSPGASLRMWSEYFPNAMIYGADIDETVLFGTEKIMTRWVDQLDPDSIRYMWDSLGVTNFDVMIDDGLHTFQAGKTLFENSVHMLSKTGLYIIEDVTFDDLLLYQNYFVSQEHCNARFVCMSQRGVYHRQNNLVIVTVIG